MRRLIFPEISAKDVISKCINGVSNAALAVRLKASEDVLAATAAKYDVHGRTQSLHLVARVSNVGAATATELKDLYRTQMGAANGAARPIYNFLRNSAGGKCPLCGVGHVTALDHHLPQSKYPDLTICVFNLIPTCDFCNNAKRSKFPSSAEEQTIHPYYDDFTKDQWVYATLNTSPPPTLRYFVNLPATWDGLKCARAQRHFSVVKLAQSYASNAADDLITLRDYLPEIEKSKGRQGVYDYLTGEAQRHAVRLNSWQHAMYQALSGSEWFLAGGYRMIQR